MIDTYDWEFIKIQLVILTQMQETGQHEAMYKLLDLFFEPKVKFEDNKELDYTDIFDAYTSVILACYQQGLKDEYYEILNLIDNAYNTQYIKLDADIKEVLHDDDLEEAIDWLEVNFDYYQTTKFKLIKTINKTK